MNRIKPAHLVRHYSSPHHTLLFRRLYASYDALCQPDGDIRTAVLPEAALSADGERYCLGCYVCPSGRGCDKGERFKHS